MSGPKAADYTLEERRLMQLRREQAERLIRLEAIRRKQEETRRNVAAIRQCVANTESAVQDSVSGARQQWALAAGMNIQVDEEYRVRIEQVLQRLQQLKQKYDFPEQLAESQGIDAVKGCQAGCSSIMGALGVIQRQTLSVISQIEERTASVSNTERMRIRKQVEEDIKARNLAKQEAEERKRNEIKKQVDIAAAQIKQMITVYAARLPVNGDTIQKIQNYCAELNGILTQQSVEPEWKLTQLHTFSILAERDLKKLTEQWEKVLELQIKYAALVEMLGWTLPKISTNPDELAALIEQANKELEERAVRHQVQEAIKECLEEMGYCLLGERVINGSGVPDEGCSDMLYHMHGNTVLHVTRSSAGIIAMEIGQGQEGRRVLQDSEVQEQVREMEAFCAQYPEFQRRLREKGVVAQGNEMRCPASRDYAHAIDLTEFGVHIEALRPNQEPEQAQCTTNNTQFFDDQGGQNA